MSRLVLQLRDASRSLKWASSRTVVVARRRARSLSLRSNQGSAQVEELLSEQQRQTRDLHQSFVDRKLN
jgi:hypothetical protein